MNSMREILALRGGYERGRVPLPSPMPPESGAPPHNTHPSVVLLRHQPRPRHPFCLTILCSRLHCLSCLHMHAVANRTPLLIPCGFVLILFFFSFAIHFLSQTPLRTTRILFSMGSHRAPITDDHLQSAVSGGSAERTTKMAAAAADFVYSPSGGPIRLLFPPVTLSSFLRFCSLSFF